MKTRWRCDVSMARKKGVLRMCDKKCRYCLCAISIDEFGREEHVADMTSTPCGNFTLRNLKVMMGRDHE